MTITLRLKPRNNKSINLRSARDRLHLKGEHAPNFKRTVELIVEILDIVFSPRNLSYCRREAQKIRESTPDPTIEQLQLLGLLQDRLDKKAEKIARRAELREAKKATKSGPKRRKGQEAPIPPAPVTLPQGRTPWDNI